MDKLQKMIFKWLKVQEQMLILTDNQEKVK